MALLRRYGLYTILTAGFICFLYSLSFPYDPVPLTYRPRPKKIKNQKYKSFDWASVPWQNPVDSVIPLPTSKPTALPQIQFKFGKEDAADKKIREARLDDVKQQFLKCWNHYKEYAWMDDEVRPISGDVSNHFGGWAATLIDALDTLYIMGFEEEFAMAVEDIEDIDFGYTDLDKVNVFETNIRHLGGLLASYELSGDKRLLNKAKEAGEMLLHAFDTPNHMPITRWQFRAAGEGKPQKADEQVLLAEIGSLTMEFTRLSELTGEPKWFDAVNRVIKVLDEQQSKTQLPGMWPTIVNASNADFTSDGGFTLGSMSDSTYEYFGKQYALLGGRDPIYRKMYEKSMETASKHALYRPSTPDNTDMLMAGFVRVEKQKIYLDPEMQHLSCYTGGMFALGGKIFQNDEHVEIGRKLANTCVWAYRVSPVGIMPEVSHLLNCKDKKTCKWDEKAWLDGIRLRTADSNEEKDPVKNIANLRLPTGFTSIEDRRYLLRPEAIESVFVMWRITGEQQWQNAAWNMWTAIMKVTDTDIGNSALRDVSANPPPREDSMESFWMAETLKYFYLIFSEPSVISLDDWVFNTEAHPFKIPKP
ncbi:Glyco-hydro-47 domain containing protein [Pyrenophora tritici-repentis]|nr:Glyco-hydro-47 domain containing protein [Pyrenophora tritici-repentis]